MKKPELRFEGTRWSPGGAAVDSLYSRTALGARAALPSRCPTQRLAPELEDARWCCRTPSRTACARSTEGRRCCSAASRIIGPRLAAEKSVPSESTDVRVLTFQVRAVGSPLRSPGPPLPTKVLRASDLSFNLGLGLKPWASKFNKYVGVKSSEKSLLIVA